MVVLTSVKLEYSRSRNVLGGQEVELNTGSRVHLQCQATIESLLCGR